jgi:hypothetical protein
MPVHGIPIPCLRIIRHACLHNSGRGERMTSSSYGGESAARRHPALAVLLQTYPNITLPRFALPLGNHQLVVMHYYTDASKLGRVRYGMLMFGAAGLSLTTVLCQSSIPPRMEIRHFRLNTVLRLVGAKIHRVRPGRLSCIRCRFLLCRSACPGYADPPYPWRWLPVVPCLFFAT